MGDILKLIWWAVIGLFRSKVSLEAEILTLRHQLNVLRRKSPKRLARRAAQNAAGVETRWHAARTPVARADSRARAAPG
jgi:hypothetical protein